MDVDNLSAGQRFDLELDKALSRCNVFLAVIGPQWLSMLRSRQAAGGRDFVREEIASALARDILVIPVVIDGAPLPRPEELPDDIRALVFHQKHDVTHARFGRDIEDLKAIINATGRAKSPLANTRIWIVLLTLVGSGLALWAAMSFLAGRPPAPIEETKSKPPAKRAPFASVEPCTNPTSMACLRHGAIPGLISTSLSGLSCSEERLIAAADLKWKGIWTTSVYSYAPGGGGPGGGLENEVLRVGGWGDWYYSLMRFEMPALARPARFAAILLFAKQDDGDSVGMMVERITQSWGWRPGDRLWWKDKPATTAIANAPPPQVGKWYVIDITSTFEDWRSGRLENYGIQLKPIANNKNYNAFHSTNSTEIDKRPQLLLCT